MLQTTHKGLSGTALKTIALVLMLMDHIHYFFEFTGCIPEWFSMLARLSAPLFLFCTVEGFAHTHDRKRYFFRIWCIGAGMAAVQFFMIYAKAFRRGDGFYPQNAIFQDFVLLCVIWQGIDWVRAKSMGRALPLSRQWSAGRSCLLQCWECSRSLCRGRLSAPCWRLSSPARCPCGPASRTVVGATWLAACCCICCGTTAKHR